MSVLIYWPSQVLLILLHTLYSLLPHSPCVRALLYILLPPTLFVTFFSAVGGPLLQLTGVFVNVHCLAGARSWLHPDNPEWWLNLATDTLLVRQLGRYRWRYTGIAGLGFLCAVSVFAWWFQGGVKTRCAKAIARLQGTPLPELVDACQG